MELRGERRKANWSLYTKEINTLGDHIRKKSLDLGLTQKEVGAQIGVTAQGVQFWEMGRARPRTRYVPGIILFLGYTPYRIPSCFSEWLRQCRVSNGLRQEDLAKGLAIDESTVMKWEAGRAHPSRDSTEKLRVAFGT